MAEPTTPPKKGGAVTAEQALRRMLGDPNKLIRDLENSHYSGLLNALQGASGNDPKFQSSEGPRKAEAAGEALKPALVGEDREKKRSRGRRSKVLTVGGVRSVRYYYWTIHELSMLGARRASALRSFAIAAFCGGVVADGIKDSLLNPPAEGTAKGVWLTLVIVAAVTGVYNLIVGLSRSKKAEEFQKEVIDEHDFD